VADLTNEEIAELRRLERAATPGPWETKGPGDGWGDHVGIVRVPDHKDRRAVIHAWGLDEWAKDAAFIAAARNALPRLLDLAERSSPAREPASKVLACRECGWTAEPCVHEGARLAAAFAALAPPPAREPEGLREALESAASLMERVRSALDNGGGTGHESVRLEEEARRARFALRRALAGETRAPAPPPAPREAPAGARCLNCGAPATHQTHDAPGWGWPACDKPECAAESAPAAGFAQVLTVAAKDMERARTAPGTPAADPGARCWCGAPLNCEGDCQTAPDAHRTPPHHPRCKAHRVPWPCAECEKGGPAPAIHLPHNHPPAPSPGEDAATTGATLAAERRGSWLGGAAAAYRDTGIDGEVAMQRAEALRRRQVDAIRAELAKCAPSPDAKGAKGDRT
jgi:hypothetical protein